MLATSGVHFFRLGCVCVFIPSPVEVPGTPIGASFLKFELKLIGKDIADPARNEF